MHLSLAARESSSERDALGISCGNSETPHHFFGYSIAMLEDLCEQGGYAVLELDYNNAFLTAKELAGEQAIDAKTAYRQGYLDRPDRKKRFWLDFDMEIIHSLGPEDASKFLREFYSKDEGRYYLAIDKASLVEALDRPAMQPVGEGRIGV